MHKPHAEILEDAVAAGRRKAKHPATLSIDAREAGDEGKGIGRVSDTVYVAEPLPKRELSYIKEIYS